MEDIYPRKGRDVRQKLEEEASETLGCLLFRLFVLSKEEITLKNCCRKGEVVPGVMSLHTLQG